jgi:hypothetical protein
MIRGALPSQFLQLAEKNDENRPLPIQRCEFPVNALSGFV